MTIPDTQRYIPSLDGLRAGAVALVIAAHFGLDGFVPGGFGVTAFFWISGFLITGQLLGELQATGRLDFGRFYLRRMLRLMPAALFYIAVAGLVFTLVAGPMPLPAWLSAIFYGANYYDLYVGFPDASSEAQNPLTHLWSLAVEEHFYIIWPIALVFLARRRLSLATLVVVIVAVLAWRVWLFHACFPGGHPGPPGGVCGVKVEYRLYKSTDTRLDSIAWGALVAVMAAGSARGLLQRLVDNRVVQIAALLLLIATFGFRGAEFREAWRYSAQGLALCVLIPAVCGNESLVRRMLEWPISVSIGRLSYSLYLWHWGALQWAEFYAPNSRLTQAALASVLTLVGALVSYYAVERPMVRLRRLAGSHATTTLVTPVPAGPVLARLGDAPGSVRIPR